MDIKSLGPFSAASSIGSDRESSAKAVRSQSAFVRATPPEATPASDSDSEEVRQGLVRMADYLRKFQGRKKRKKKSPSSKKSLRMKALHGYSRVSRFENEQAEKGFHLSLKI